MTLALGGIAVVLGAVLAAMGALALLGLPSSLIIVEVLPFLVLAVGADNIFIFVQEFQVGAPRGAGVQGGGGGGGGGWGHRSVGAWGAFGCWGPFRLEGGGEHPWVPGTAWVGWALGFFGCRGSPREAGHWGAPLGARDSLGVVGIGCLWVLGSL